MSAKGQFGSPICDRKTPVTGSFCLVYYAVMKKRTALFTGTFDPFHLGHAQQLERVHAVVPFDEVIVAPIMHNPNKPHAVEWRHRTALAGLTLASLDLPFRVRVEPIETIDAPTIALFCRTHMEDDRPLRIVGGDSIIEFIDDSAHWPTLGAFTYAVVMRPAVRDEEVLAAIERLPDAVAQTFQYSIVGLGERVGDISARNLRGDIAGSAQYLAQPARDYMAAHGLYEKLV